MICQGAQPVNVENRLLENRQTGAGSAICLCTYEATYLRTYVPLVFS